MNNRRLYLSLFLIAATQVPLMAAPAGDPNSPAILLALPATPQIDARDTDWPAAPAQKLSSPGGSAIFRIAADAANFYAFIQVADPSPLKNNAARPEESLKGGDAIALYFGGPPAAPQRVLIAQRNGQTEIYAYRPKSAVKKPYTFSSPVGDAAFDYVAPLAGAKAALRADKTGYLAEIQIPWKNLGFTAQPLTFPFELQVIFSDPAGTTNAAMAWWHSKGGPGDTVEDLPTEARLYPETWGVASVAALAGTALPRADAAVPGIPIKYDLPRAGRVSLYVTDATGWIVRELVLAEKQGKGAHTMEWDGRDRYGEPLPPGKYAWKALLFDGMAAKFMGSVGNSGRPPYRTPDGLGSMGGQHGVPTALAADEGGIYMAGGAEEGQPAMRKIAAGTGAALWKRSAGGFGSVVAVAAGEGFAAFLNQTGGRGPRTIDLVRIDPQTGLDKPMGPDSKSPARRTVILPAAQVRAAADDTTSAAIAKILVGGMEIVGKKAYFSVPTEDRIGGVNLESGEVLPDITVAAPCGIAKLDAGHLLVCSGTQILKLSLEGGTTAPFVSGLDFPRAVARDGAGNVYVSDLGKSQQVKKFAPDGKPLATWGRSGGKPFSMKAYDPLAFENVNALSVGPDGNLWLSESFVMPKRFVKLSTEGRWLEDFYGPVAYNTFGPDLDDPSVVYYNPGGNQGGAQVIEAKLDYAKYAANPKAPADGWHIAAVHDLGRGADGQTLNPLMAEVGRTGYGHYFVFKAANGKKYLFRPSKHNRAAVPPGAGLWLWQNEAWVPAAFLSRDEKTEASWADANADGLMQAGERYTGLPTNEFAWIDRDLTLNGKTGKLKASAISASGVPTYDKGQFSPYLKDGEDSYQAGWTFFSPQVKDAVYYVSNAGADRHLAFWDRSTDSRLIKVADGKVQWVIGRNTPQSTFTSWNTVTGVAGIVDDLVLVHTVDPYYFAVTTDGFNLGNVMADANGVAPAVGPTAVNIESFTGLFTKDPHTGKNVLFSVSSGDDRILEITGPGQTTRLGGEVTLDTPRPRTAQTAETTVIPYETWYGNVARDLGIDGEDTEWQPFPGGVPIYAGGALIGDVRFRRDAGSLFVLADVLDPGSLQAGEGIELQIAPQGAAAPRKLFLSVAPGKAGKWQARVQVDDGLGANAEVAKQIKIGFAPRWRGLGYRLEAEIPLSSLPEVSTPREQKFRREARDATTGKVTGIEIKTAVLPDLAGPLRLSATVVRLENGAARRYSWPQTGLGTALVP